MLNNIPAELRSLPQWVCSGADKVPVNPRTGQAASVNDPATWGTFEEALHAGMKHVGFVLAPWGDYTIIDLDNKPDKPLTPEQYARMEAILAAFPSYTERSTSGRGYHIIVRGKIPFGVHRDNVEMYSSGRYMICTGDVVNPLPVANCQELLDRMYGQMKPEDSVALVETDEVVEDIDLIEMASCAANGEKFNTLCSGDMTGYPSQSEADLALLSILAFYTNSNEQVRRLFRMSALGKREKAVKNDTYLNFALSKIRAKQPPPVNMADLAANAAAMRAPAPPPLPNPLPPPPPPPIAPVNAVAAPPAQVPGVILPPGMVGDLARYYYSTAIRPVPEIALAAAIATLSGVCGRSYNISDTGLNQYIVLLARTGRGKEGALGGITKLMAAVRPMIPMADQFMGPSAFASGQALLKTVSKRPCFVSVLGEFGLTLQQISDARANSAEKMLKRVLLDLFSKSGWRDVLLPAVYADSEKNTELVHAPCVTILGESTPETFYEGLDSSHISEGLIPRFMIMEYDGARPARNRNAGAPPAEELKKRFADMLTLSLTTANNGTCCPVQVDAGGMALLDSFDAKADTKINSGNTVEAELWNRAHLKSLRLAGIIAVGVNPHQPVVTAEIAQWAINMVTRDVEGVLARFNKGDVGVGDSKQLVDLRRVIQGYYDKPAPERWAGVHSQGLIPYALLLQRTSNMVAFRQDRMGATNALKNSLRSLVDSGELVEIDRATLLKNYQFSGVAYGVGKHWNRGG